MDLRLELIDPKLDELFLLITKLFGTPSNNFIRKLGQLGYDR